MSYDGTIRINTRLNTSDYESGVKSLGSSLKSLAKTIGVAFSVAQIVKFDKECVELSSSLTEVDNVVSKSFGNMRSEMDELANKAVKTLGMSRLTAYETGSTFMSMGRAMMDDQVAAKDMALELTKLTANMASFYNKEQDLVSIALKSVYTGETETLKQYGIVMTEVNLKQFALEQGITKSYSAMTQAEKVQLRYNYVMAQTAFIGDDFLDTQDSWANQTRILTEQWKEFMTIVGNGLVTVLTPVVKVLNNIVSSLITLANTVGTVMSKVFGIKGQQLSIAGANESAADSYEDAAESAGAYTDATNSASKAAKNAVANFDDVNVLDTSSSSGSSGGAGSSTQIETEEVEAESSAIDELSDSLTKVQAIWTSFTKGISDGWKEADGILDLSAQVENIKANCETIKQELIGIWDSPEVQKAINNFAYTLGSAMAKNVASTASIGLTIGQAITGGLARYLSEGGADDIKQFVIDMCDIMGEFMTTTADFSVAFAEVFSALGGENGQIFVENLIAGIATATGTILETVAKLGRDIADMLLRPFTENSSGLKSMLDGMLGTFNIFGQGVLMVINYLADAWETFYDNSLAPLFETIGDGLSTLLAVFIAAYEAYLKPALDELGVAFQELLVALQPLFDVIQVFLSWLSPILQFIWKNILVPLLSFIAITMVQQITSAITKITEKIQKLSNFINTVVTAFKVTINAIKTAIIVAVNAIKVVFKAAVNFIIGLLNGVLGAIEQVGNGIVKLVNWALSGIRGLVNGMADLLKHAGVNINVPDLQLGTLKLSRIPTLANGGVTTGSTLAQIGEAGREAVLPLENNTGWMDDLAGKLADLMGGNSEAVMEIDGKRFGQLMYPYMRNEQSRIGTSFATN